MVVRTFLKLFMGFLPQVTTDTLACVPVISSRCAIFLKFFVHTRLEDAHGHCPVELLAMCMASRIWSATLFSNVFLELYARLVVISIWSRVASDAQQHNTHFFLDTYPGRC